MNLNETIFSRGRGRGRGRATFRNPRGAPLGRGTFNRPHSRVSDRSFAAASSSRTNWGGVRQSVGVTPRTSTPSKSYTSESEEHIILALSEGRGEARCEVGMAAINITQPSLMLCQVSDVHSYINTLTKINILNPSEILIPITFAGQNNRLIEKIKQHFVGVKITPVTRSTFSKKVGLERIKQICLPSLNSVLLILQHKYYALAAASALLIHAENYLHIYYASEAVKVEYQESEGFTTIDILTADKLELVACTRPLVANTRYSSLLAIVNGTVTKLGARSLRSSILQPPCCQRDIETKLECVSELVANAEIRGAIQSLLSKVPNMDQILTLATLLRNDPDSCSERHLNYVLLWNIVLGIIEPLREVLKRLKLPFFLEMGQLLEDEAFRDIKTKVTEFIHSDGHPAKGSNGIVQRCFAIKSGVNGLLDCVRKTYSDRMDDMNVHVRELTEKYGLPLTLSNNSKKGYHLVLKLSGPQVRTLKPSDLPPEFLQVQRLARNYTMKTEELINLSTRLEDIIAEIIKMSNMMIHQMLVELSRHMSLFYKLCEDVAHLDLLQALAEISASNNYVKPKFGDVLELVNARHPILEYVCATEPIPNSVSASREYNMHLITGPNGSGKSIFIRKIVLIQIMAQIGCFVPASSATLRVADRILARIYLEDNMDFGASTFTFEMKEIQYFLTTVTENSLIIMDELCRSTSAQPGMALAMAICEKLMQTPAFIFCTTHYRNLTELGSLYCNVQMWHLDTNLSSTDPSTAKLVYRYKVLAGLTPLQKYSIYLVKGVWPARIVAEIEEFVNQQSQFVQTLTAYKVHPKIRLMYDIEAEMRILDAKNQLSRETAENVLQKHDEQLKFFNITVRFSEYTKNDNVEDLSYSFNEPPQNQQVSIDFLRNEPSHFDFNPEDNDYFNLRGTNVDTSLQISVDRNNFGDQQEFLQIPTNQIDVSNVNTIGSIVGVSPDTVSKSIFGGKKKSVSFKEGHLEEFLSQVSDLSYRSQERVFQFDSERRSSTATDEVGFARKFRGRTSTPNVNRTNLIATDYGNSTNEEVFLTPVSSEKNFSEFSPRESFYSVLESGSAGPKTPQHIFQSLNPEMIENFTTETHNRSTESSKKFIFSADENLSTSRNHNSSSASRSRKPAFEFNHKNPETSSTSQGTFSYFMGKTRAETSATFARKCVEEPPQQLSSVNMCEFEVSEAVKRDYRSSSTSESKFSFWLRKEGGRSSTPFGQNVRQISESFDDGRSDERFAYSFRKPVDKSITLDANDSSSRPEMGSSSIKNVLSAVECSEKSKSESFENSRQEKLDSFGSPNNVETSKNYSFNRSGLNSSRKSIDGRVMNTSKTSTSFVRKITPNDTENLCLPSRNKEYSSSVLSFSTEVDKDLYRSNRGDFFSNNTPDSQPKTLFNFSPKTEINENLPWGKRQSQSSNVTKTIELTGRSSQIVRKTLENVSESFQPTPPARTSSTFRNSGQKTPHSNDNSLNSTSATNKSTKTSDNCRPSTSGTSPRLLSVDSQKSVSMSEGAFAEELLRNTEKTSTPVVKGAAKKCLTGLQTYGDVSQAEISSAVQDMLSLDWDNDGEIVPTRNVEEESMSYSPLLEISGKEVVASAEVRSKGVDFQSQEQPTAFLSKKVMDTTASGKTLAKSKEKEGHLEQLLSQDSNFNVSFRRQERVFQFDSERRSSTTTDKVGFARTFQGRNSTPNINQANLITTDYRSITNEEVFLTPVSSEKHISEFSPWETYSVSESASSRAKIPQHVFQSLNPEMIENFTTETHSRTTESSKKFIFSADENSKTSGNHDSKGADFQSQKQPTEFSSKKVVGTTSSGETLGKSKGKEGHFEEFVSQDGDFNVSFRRQERVFQFDSERRSSTTTDEGGFARTFRGRISTPNIKRANLIATDYKSITNEEVFLTPVSSEKHISEFSPRETYSVSESASRSTESSKKFILSADENSKTSGNYDSKDVDFQPQKQPTEFSSKKVVETTLTVKTLAKCKEKDVHATSTDTSSSSTPKPIIKPKKFVPPLKTDQKKPLKPTRPMKFVPPQMLSKKAIRQDFYKQTRKAFESKADYSDYLQMIKNRPTVRQIQESTYIACIRRTNEGCVVIPAPPPRQRAKRSELPYSAKFASVPFDATILSDRNSGKLEMLLKGTEGRKGGQTIAKSKSFTFGYEYLKVTAVKNTEQRQFHGYSGFKRNKSCELGWISGDLKEKQSEKISETASFVSQRRRLGTRGSFKGKENLCLKPKEVDTKNKTSRKVNIISVVTLKKPDGKTGKDCAPRQSKNIERESNVDGTYKRDSNKLLKRPPEPLDKKDAVKKPKLLKSEKTKINRMLEKPKISKIRQDKRQQLVNSEVSPQSCSKNELTVVNLDKNSMTNDENSSIRIANTDFSVKKIDSTPKKEVKTEDLKSQNTKTLTYDKLEGGVPPMKELEVASPDMHINLSIEGQIERIAGPETSRLSFQEAIGVIPKFAVSSCTDEYYSCSESPRNPPTVSAPKTDLKTFPEVTGKQVLRLLSSTDDSEDFPQKSVRTKGGERKRSRSTDENHVKSQNLTTIRRSGIENIPQKPTVSQLYPTDEIICVFTDSSTYFELPKPTRRKPLHEISCSMFSSQENSQQELRNENTSVDFDLAPFFTSTPIEHPDQKRPRGKFFGEQSSASDGKSLMLIQSGVSENKSCTPDGFYKQNKSQMNKIIEKYLGKKEERGKEDLVVGLPVLKIKKPDEE